MSEKSPVNIFWFRRDLRLHDNHGLWQALKSGNPVLPVFIFDREILDPLPKRDARVLFIHQELTRLRKELSEAGSSMLVVYGFPEKVWSEILEEYQVETVFTNHDYEPYARRRDGQLRKMLHEKGIGFQTYRDQVIFEEKEILTTQDKPYTVYTPFSKKWLNQVSEDRLKSFATEQHFSNFFQTSTLEMPSLEEMGFEQFDFEFPGRNPEEEIIANYGENRNFPARQGTSRIGIHLRFGTVSIRELVRRAQKLNKTYLNELIWREFYMQILANYPHVVEGPFRPEYGAIRWRDDDESFEKWKEGKTGYPLVDAGMRQLAETGYMHNRVRMVTASFLAKHLLINWQLGEAWFAEKLLDFELASNNGGWQWAAGCGTDAAPYFRIFNPESQQKKFDPEAKYIRKWVPEYGTPTYPNPIVEHKFARERCLDAYKTALNKE